MRSALLSPVHDLLAKAEESLGKRIELVEDSELPVAGTTAVLASRPNHGKIVFSPKYRDCVSYVIANQCCHILRYARAPPAHRVVPVEREGAYLSVYRLVEQQAKQNELYRLPREAMSELAHLFLTGMVVQVTSTPADCRIDRRLYEQIPGLRNDQGRALEKMLSLYLQSLGSDAKSWTPSLIYQASKAMNGAFARNATGLFPELWRYAARYEQELGELVDSLTLHLEAQDEGYVSDVRMTDVWATALGLQELYEWRHERELSRRSRGSAPSLKVPIE